MDESSFLYKCISVVYKLFEDLKFLYYFFSFYLINPNLINNKFLYYLGLFFAMIEFIN